MATDQLTPLLLDAKREYVGQLTDVMAPYVLSFLANLRATSPTLVDFQHRLREIPVWNSNVVAQRTQEIEGRFPYLNDLIAAVFVSYTKILSSIKLGEDKPNIRLRLPANDQVVHSVYIYTAKDMYETAGLVNADRATRIATVRNAIETAVRASLPIAEILRAYLGNVVDADNTVNPIPDMMGVDGMMGTDPNGMMMGMDPNGGGMMMDPNGGGGMMMDPNGGMVMGDGMGMAPMVDEFGNPVQQQQQQFQAPMGAQLIAGAGAVAGMMQPAQEAMFMQPQPQPQQQFGAVQPQPQQQFGAVQQPQQPQFGAVQQPQLQFGAVQPVFQAQQPFLAQQPQQQQLGQIMRVGFPGVQQPQFMQQQQPAQLFSDAEDEF
jgi:hypothetical protein